MLGAVGWGTCESSMAASPHHLISPRFRRPGPQCRVQCDSLLYGPLWTPRHPRQLLPLPLPSSLPPWERRRGTSLLLFALCSTADLLPHRDPCRLMALSFSSTCRGGNYTSLPRSPSFSPWAPSSRHWLPSSSSHSTRARPRPRPATSTPRTRAGNTSSPPFPSSCVCSLCLFPLA